MRTGAKCGTAHAGGGAQEGRDPMGDGPDAGEEEGGEEEEGDEGKGDTAATARRGEFRGMDAPHDPGFSRIPLGPVDEPRIVENPLTFTGKSPYP